MIPEDQLPPPETADETKVRPPSKRRQNRIAAMQFIYAEEANSHASIPEALYDFFSNREHPREFYAFGEELAGGMWERRQQIDEIIQQYTQNWDFNRIARVDLAILRLAIYELFHRMDIPPIVSINEAIELSKDFSTPESKRFVNGILDRLKNQLNRPLRTAMES